MKTMRRVDREIKDPNAIRAIMAEAPVCRIGLSDDGMPYVVPMSFGLARAASTSTAPPRGGCSTS